MLDDLCFIPDVSIDEDGDALERGRAYLDSPVANRVMSG